ncbi:MAG: hypothetical protein H7196_00555 [candidate division SR1 bacterium]|nr:hypothetical protein [candidate division SR1 bacterium]
MIKNNKLNQLLPLVLAIVTFFGVTILFYISIKALNLFPGEKIGTDIRIVDILIGLTIYLKTSIDFAIFIGSLMKTYPGVKNRIAIEVGTAVGNMAGTIAVMIVWYFFKEIKILLGLMVLLASLVLFRLAESSVEHIVDTHDDGHENQDNQIFISIARKIISFIKPINTFLAPVLDKIIPHFGTNTVAKKTVLGLLGVSFSIPFILGLDDFAGYVPLFNVVNIFGFGIGVFLGHAILNILLFINPTVTIKIVKNPVISIIGAIAFVGLACWGLYEVVHIFLG